MSCGNGKFTKKKALILAGIISVMVVATYTVFTTTRNPAIAATIPALLALGACPAMCVGVGGVIWLMNRISNKSRNNNNQAVISGNIETKQISERRNNNNSPSCCSEENNSIQENTITQKEEMITKNTDGQANATDITLPNPRKEWQRKHVMDYNN